MTIQLKTEAGIINMDQSVIASVVGGAVSDIYGIVGMVSTNQWKDNWNELLKKENYERGVTLEFTGDGLVIDLNIVVGYGVKISEVCRNVQETVQYQLETTVGISAIAINVCVQGVRVLDSDKV